MREHGDRLLAQRPLWWKLLNSIWILVVPAGFVFFSVLGWALGAVLARKKDMWLLTLGWGVAYAAALTFFGLIKDRSDMSIVPFLIAWIGSTVHAVYLGREVLRWRAVALEKDAGWRSQGALPHTPPPPPPPQGFMPTIPMPDGVPQHRGNVTDSAPPIPRPGGDQRY